MAHGRFGMRAMFGMQTASQVVEILAIAALVFAQEMSESSQLVVRLLGEFFKSGHLVCITQSCDAVDIGSSGRNRPCKATVAAAGAVEIDCFWNMKNGSV